MTNDFIEAAPGISIASTTRHARSWTITPNVSTNLHYYKTCDYARWKLIPDPRCGAPEASVTETRGRVRGTTNVRECPRT